MRLRHWLLCTLLLFTGCSRKTTAQGVETNHLSLTEARRGFVTKLAVKENVGEPAPAPLAGVFELVKYPSPVGELSAYVSHAPADGQKHPVILWIVGGFSSSISQIAWTPGPADNDQSASSFRQSGVLMMYPSLLRGGNDNPGFMENFYGEVDDVLAAREWLAKQPFVDPQRIYLGGHSTGGTLALLCAECSDVFQGVFAFGPVANVRGYGPESLVYDLSNPKESQLRSPLNWLDSVSSPTFVFEGANPRSNVDDLRTMAKANRNPAIKFYPVPKATHFSDIQPVSKLIAAKILRDTGPIMSINFSEQEIAGAIANSR